MGPCTHTHKHCLSLTSRRSWLEWIKRVGEQVPAHRYCHHPLAGRTHSHSSYAVIIRFDHTQSLSLRTQSGQWHSRDTFASTCTTTLLRYRTASAVIMSGKQSSSSGGGGGKSGGGYSYTSSGTNAQVRLTLLVHTVSRSQVWLADDGMCAGQPLLLARLRLICIQPELVPLLQHQRQLLLLEYVSRRPHSLGVVVLRCFSDASRAHECIMCI